MDHQILLLHSAFCYFHFTLSFAQVVKFNEQGRSYDFTDQKLKKEYEEELKLYNELFGGFGNVSGYVHIDVGDVEYDLEDLRRKKECYNCYFVKGPHFLSKYGSENCLEPFVEDGPGIHIVKCEGACGWAKGQLRPGVNFTFRGCFEACRDYSGRHCQVRCCRGTRCNHFWAPDSSSRIAVPRVLVLLLVGVATFV